MVLKSKVENSLKERQEYLLEFNKTSEEIKKWSQDTKDLLKKEEELADVVINLQKENFNLENNFEDEIENLEKKMQSEEANLKEDMKSHRNKQSRMIEQITNITMQNKNAEDEIQKDEEELNKLFMEIDEISKETRLTHESYTHIERKRKELAEKIDDMEAEIFVLVQSNDEAKVDLKILEEKKQDLKVNIRSMEKYQDVHKKEDIRISNCLVNMEREQKNVLKILQTLEEQNKETDEKIQLKKHEINSNNEKLNSFKKKHNLLCKMLKKKEGEIEKNKIEQDQLEDELFTAKKNLSNEEHRISKMKETKLKEEKQIEKLEEVLRKKKDGLVEGSNKLLEYERITKKMNNQIAGVHFEIKQLGMECEKIKNQQEKYAEVASMGHTKFYEKIEELKLKNFMVGDLQRVNSELATRLKEEQGAYEGVRKERNAHGKRLLEMKEEIVDCANKHKGLVHEIKQLSEEVSIKNIYSIRQTEKSETIKNQNIELENRVMGLENKNSTLEQTIKYNEGEIDKLKVLLVEAEDEKKKKMKEQTLIMNERDILSRQIIRRKQDMNKVLKNIKILQYYIKNTESQFQEYKDKTDQLSETLETTKAELKTSQLEATGLETIKEEVTKLNKECWILKNRNSMLKEEIGIVINVHQWREIKATEPEKYDLILKLQGLQKKNAKEEHRLNSIDGKISEKKKLFKSLRETMGRGIGPQGLKELKKLQIAFKEKKRRLNEVMKNMEESKKLLASLENDVLKLDTSIDMHKKNYFNVRLENLGQNQESEKENVLIEQLNN
jgi:chromosome segregation ATPase